MQQFDYNKYRKNNPLLKEAKTKEVKELRVFTGTYRLEETKPGSESFDITFGDVETGVYMIMNPEDAHVYGSSGVDVQDLFQKMVDGSNMASDDDADFEETKKPMQEDLALVGNIALGVAGGLAGLYALVKTTKFLGFVAGQGLMALGNKLQSSAKTAARGRRKEFIMGIVKKFEGDTELQSMYAALPPYTPKTKNERNNQMRKIATYIKSKLNPEEMDYFNDISSMLRTGDLVENQETKKPMKEYDKDSVPEMQELLKMLKDIQDKNKQIKAIGVKTLEKMIYDLERSISSMENSTDNVSVYNNN